MDDDDRRRVPKPLDARPPAARHIECINGQQFRFTRWGKRWVVHTRCDCVFGPHWHETPYAGKNLTVLRATIRDAIGELTTVTERTDDRAD